MGTPRDPKRLPRRQLSVVVPIDVTGEEGKLLALEIERRAADAAAEVTARDVLDALVKSAVHDLVQDLVHEGKAIRRAELEEELAELEGRVRGIPDDERDERELVSWHSARQTVAAAGVEDEEES